MTVGELIEELERYNSNNKVLIKPCNSMYVEHIDCACLDEVRAFYGNDYNAVVIYAESQAGAV